MGCDIHSWAEVKRNGKWERITDDIFGEPDYANRKTSEPFGGRNYRTFSFIGNCRNGWGTNDKEIENLQYYRDLPNDSEYLNQVSPYAYDRNPMNGKEIPIEERETNRGDINNNPNWHSINWLLLSELLEFDYNKEHGIIGSPLDGITYKEFLSDEFFLDLEILKTLGDPQDVRIIYYFDN